jgi:hypothetical protein
MTLKQGWINRQFARVERDSRTWPEWMRRETEIRGKEQEDKSEAGASRPSQQPAQTAKNSGGA